MHPWPYPRAYRGYDRRAGGRTGGAGGALAQRVRGCPGAGRHGSHGAGGKPAGRRSCRAAVSKCGLDGGGTCTTTACAASLVAGGSSWTRTAPCTSRRTGLPGRSKTGYPNRHGKRMEAHYRRRRWGLGNRGSAISHPRSSQDPRPDPPGARSSGAGHTCRRCDRSCVPSAACRKRACSRC